MAGHARYMRVAVFPTTALSMRMVCLAGFTLAVLLDCFPLSLFVAGYDIEEDSGRMDCTSGLRHFDPLRHKETYYVGLHAPGGIDTALREYNLTFQDYLTATAGQRFDPPIQFKVKPTTTPLFSWVDDEEEEVDFYYSDTGVYSCVGVEAGAQLLATTVSEFDVRGHAFQLDMFSGVMFTRADRDDISNIRDIKGKIVGALEIGDFAGAQVQFYAMHAAGMDYIMDPKQVIFVGNQLEIVQGVLRGDWEVGFVRTGMIELSVDADGDLLDPNLFKILDPSIYVMDDGLLFPFLHSTPVFPEWPFYSNEHIPKDVAMEVRDALYALGQHRVVGKKIQECMGEFSIEHCQNKSIEDLYPDSRCDTTWGLANLAYTAAKAGHTDGFRSPRSYFDLRTMQQAAGFLNQDKKGHWQCTRAESLLGAISCPVGHYKINEQQFEESCEKINLPCPEGLSCYCEPCVKAFEVDLHVFNEGEEHDESAKGGCDKMSMCGAVPQRKTVKFLAHDNRERINADVHAVMHIGQDALELDVERVTNSSFSYSFEFSYTHIAVGILEFYVNNEQIPQSPIRVQVIPRDCELDFSGQSKEPSVDGECICASNTIQIGELCASSVVFSVSISLGSLFIVLLLGLWYLGYKRKQNDQLWLVNVEELIFSDPVEIIGQGSFGVVLLAEYRGTKVAIKRALPPGRKKKKGSVAGSGDNGSKESAPMDVGINRSSSSDLESHIEKPTFGTSSLGSTRTGTSSQSNDLLESNLDFLAGLHYGRKKTKLETLFPWLFSNTKLDAKEKAYILGSASSGGDGSKSKTPLMGRLCPWLDKNNKKTQSFIVEMRLLSCLRHPGITTVMGAVISPVTDPMLVMEYMEYGSLHDLLRNETMYTGGEIILPICRDIAQGLRYLHSSRPPILHGDIKARNILIDSRFRAKVADFGLSTKKKHGLSGTPYFMAPEYLRGKSEYHAECDIYSVGILLWEIYSRQDPYHGENPREVLRKVCDPRFNKRPIIAESCPPAMADIMKKCWSPDPFFRPQAKDLDMIFMDMNMNDAEPGGRAEAQIFNQPKTKAMTTEQMLYAVFPHHIAKALNEGQKVEPESHDNVTVVFSEIVHFADISKTISSLKICQMLDRLYLAFDEVAKKHHIFKVETVGDAYMGVTNLEGTEEKTHVKQVAEFAIELLEAANEIMIDEDDPKQGHIRIRVGFHSGPVVSNVIGSLNPRYGLFGDTVNTASRMETSSYSGRIHCSQCSAKLLVEQAPNIIVVKRGKIGIKGKGEMTTYWVGDPSKGTRSADNTEKGVGEDELAVECAPVKNA